MKKYILSISLSVLFLIISAGANAQEEAGIIVQGPPSISEEETVTISDLGITNPGVLPTSPLYFFKELGRGVQDFFVFNPVAKAELHLKFTNEKAAEAKKITETEPQNTQAIQKALENYQKSQENLRKRFEAIKETSQNPKIDELLNKLTEKTVKHEKLFDEISFKFGEKEQITKEINRVKKGSENLVGEAAKKDDSAKFASRLEKVLLEERGGELKHARSVEIIDRFSNKTPEAVKESLKRLREEFSEKLETDIQELVEKGGEDILKEKIGNTPGDFAKRSVIIEEIQKRAEERLAQALEKARKPLEELLKKEMDINEKAKEQIERAEKIINEAEQKAIVSELLGEAREHLKEAKAAFEEEKYGEAFGQARSAEVLARNAFKSFEREKPQSGNFEQHLKELAEKINTYEKLLNERNFTREQNKDAFEILDNAVLHLGYAKEAFTNGNLENTKLHMGHVRDFLTKLARIIEGKLPEKPAACTLEYNPVCGANGKTYSNACFAKITGVTVSYRGECKKESQIESKMEAETMTGARTETKIEAIKPAETIQINLETSNIAAVMETKLEADDFGFYPNSAVKAARGSKVRLTFFVRENNVYYGGLEIKSDVFKTGTIKPGSSATVEFAAEKSFEFTSWWPLSNVQKSTGKIIVE